jgi:hypothetical protein
MTRKKFSALREGLRNPASLALVLELRRTLRGCRTILDLGCGWNSPAKFLHEPEVLVGVDGYKPDLDKAKLHGTHDEYVSGDVRGAAALFPGRKFDACIAMDVIEHLTKDDGLQMLRSMEQLAGKRVVIFTPNGFVPQFSEDGNLQQHLSGWEVAEMQKMGYEVVGMHGPKGLRGEKAMLKYRPRPVWSLASVIGHYLYTRQRPETAFSIFCTKKMNS